MQWCFKSLYLFIHVQGFTKLSHLLQIQDTRGNRKMQTLPLWSLHCSDRGWRFWTRNRLRSAVSTQWTFPKRVTALQGTGFPGVKQKGKKTLRQRHLSGSEKKKKPARARVEEWRAFSRQPASGKPPSLGKLSRLFPRCSVTCRNNVFRQPM